MSLQSMGERQLSPSLTPLHANLWPSRGPTDRELSDEVGNLYRLLRQQDEKIKELEEKVLELEP